MHRRRQLLTSASCHWLVSSLFPSSHSYSFFPKEISPTSKAFLSPDHHSPPLAELALHFFRGGGGVEETYVSPPRLFLPRGSVLDFAAGCTPANLRCPRAQNHRDGVLPTSLKPQPAPAASPWVLPAQQPPTANHAPPPISASPACLLPLPLPPAPSSP
ncbi:hypothetical protein B0T26DRAFT_146110 [Lasiosphaeria miniovina]|uniref:Uncharacterized protein n=1 Tax=Lasiosphaeria miniovina TaxID=1954250 RepID=A0AA40E4I2_9PEZI|nr:uncharacterized protein B0T26DRAFT_146110 [Lasiosphaeria miniovina]KAK0727819.1 hypothetical protein B0T26DRAFT_146110 [Lasiosphaeria miniovina]